ncbi:hypothetical protein ACJJTC_006502 [Scirpophaga incertulas]
MPLEPRNAPRRSFQRIYRRIQQPYRIPTLSDRMNRYRPILPALPEEETPDHRSNIEQRRALSRYKRREPIRARVHRTLSAPDNSSSHSIQILPSQHWVRNNQYAEWHADAPQMIITSDAQLQTEATIYEVYCQLEHKIRKAKALRAQGELPERERVKSPLTVMCYGHSRSMIDKSTQTPPECFELSGLDFVQIVNAKAPQTDEEADMIYRMHSRALSLPNLPAATMESRRIASRVVNHARHNKTLNAKDMYCLDCELFPLPPVTGQCGHTRCYKCIEKNGPCPCGAEPPLTLHVNTAIQYLLRKMFDKDHTATPSTSAAREGPEEENNGVVVVQHPRVFEAMHVDNDIALLRWMRRGFNLSDTRQRLIPYHSSRVPMTPQGHFEYARRLLSFGRFTDAAPHLARVGASAEPISRVALNILSKIINVLSSHHEQRNLTRYLFRSVRYQAAASWLHTDDLECVLCFHTYTRPVTTPCGHTYCRTCIERALDYRKACALCLRPLYDFDLSATNETSLLNAALDSIDAIRETSVNDPDVIPIFVCTVAYPSIPCPLFIFDPRYWLMIRRVLDSGSRKFGMVAYEKNRNYSEYGTVLEVRDCLQLEDGRSFLSTVGVSRFRIIERDVQEGCDVARIQPLEDIIPSEQLVILNMRLMASQIMYKALIWLNSMDYSLRMEIENAFGCIPSFDMFNEIWWERADGPKWMWWLVAILPLRPEIKVLILSTKNLMKRMMAVLRTLEAIHHVSITTSAQSDCEFRSVLTNSAEWLERGS